MGAAVPPLCAGCPVMGAAVPPALLLIPGPTRLATAQNGPPSAAVTAAPAPAPAGRQKLAPVVAWQRQRLTRGCEGL